MQKFLHFMFRPDWVLDNDGDPTLRLWGFLNFTFYKWDDGAIITVTREYKRCGKRGIIAKREAN